MRPETTLILSSIDSRTLAEFPPELDPCVNEALRNEAIIEAVKGVWNPLATLEPVPVIPTVPTPVTPPEPERLFITAGDIRDADVNTREAVARAIQRVTIPEAVALTTPTAIQGVVIPKPGTGLPQMPVVIPLLALQGVEIKPEGMNMIEFQEIIPGIKPPSIPSLIPGLEKLPMLPGWTIRDPAGKILNEGVRMPLVPPIGATGIAIPPELPTEGEIAPPIAANSELHPDAVTLEKLLRDPIESEEEIADIAVELGLELDEENNSMDEEIEI